MLLARLTGAIALPNIVSNPLFQVIVLFIFATGSWFLATDETTKSKKKILTFVTDGLYYFILTSFGLNILVNFNTVIRDPYRILLFSSNISWMALVLILLYLGYLEYKKHRLINQREDQLINHTINYFLLLGLFNHLFYYYKYRSFHSVIFILVYFLFYLLKDRIEIPRINEWTLILLALVHGILMFSFSKIILYYQIVFYPYQIISLFIIASLLLYYFRRNVSSKQK